MDKQAPIIDTRIIEEIEKAFQTETRYKALKLLEQRIGDAMQQFGITKDYSILLSLLKYIKNNDKIHPSIFQIKHPIPIENPKVEFSMLIKFHNQKQKINVRFRLDYRAPSYGKYLNSCSRLTKNEDENRFIFVAREIEKRYDNF